MPARVKCNFDTENDPPGRGEHKSALKCMVDGLVFAGNEIEVAKLSPSPLVPFLVPTLLVPSHEKKYGTTNFTD